MLVPSKGEISKKGEVEDMGKKKKKKKRRIMF